MIPSILIAVAGKEREAIDQGWRFDSNNKVQEAPRRGQHPGGWGKQRTVSPSQNWKMWQKGSEVGVGGWSDADTVDDISCIL